MTRARSPHTDVSLWHVIAATPDDIAGFDEREFASVRWIGLADACTEPAGTTDPHLSRFAAKLSDRSGRYPKN